MVVVVVDVVVLEIIDVLLLPRTPPETKRLQKRNSALLLFLLSASLT